MKFLRSVMTVLVALGLLIGAGQAAQAASLPSGVSSKAISGASKTGWALDFSNSKHRLVVLHVVDGSVQAVKTVTVSFAGCNRDGCYTTPSGTFAVYRKEDRNYVSHTSQAWNGAPMPYAVFFNGGIAVHQDPLGPSHGCVHVPSMATMQYIHDNVPKKSVVIVH